MNNLLDLDEALPPQLEVTWKSRKVVIDDPSLEQVLRGRQKVGELRARGDDLYFSAGEVLAWLSLLEATESVTDVVNDIRVEVKHRAAAGPPDALDDPPTLVWLAETTPFEADELRAMPHQVYLTLAAKIVRHRQAYRRGAGTEDAEDEEEDEG